MRSVIRDFRRAVGLPGESHDASRKATNVSEASCVDERRLLVDVTEYLRFNWGTGIQRITNAFILRLTREPLEGYRVMFIFVDRAGKFKLAKNVGENLINENDCEEINAVSSDVIFFLDFSPRLLPKQYSQLKKWRRINIRMVFFVHDLLPNKRPEWFTARGVKNFNRWAALLARYGDKFLCLSDCTKTDLEDFLRKEKNYLPDNIVEKVNLELGWAPFSKIKFPEAKHPVISGTSILMVGTIEPRKGHWQVLRAFELLWEKQRDVKLIFVGRAGWGTIELQKYMRSHSLFGQKLFWKDSSTDEELMTLYRQAAGVIVASEGEGFGLPLREALHYGKAVLARDIPAFRECVDGKLTYFRGESPQSLADAILQWQDAIAREGNALPLGDQGAISYSIKGFDAAVFEAKH
ncbi:glycosyltransferase family 4 protein [Paraburkholderia sediminicola]|uniref:glycosyltransferase family 4 protein n=1 Tax=Paraburkholderia sediminicola TaxID=458836 RepID=UPI0038B6FD41